MTDGGNYRYDFYIIRSSGLEHRDEIIGFIKAEEHFEIVEMFDRRPSNLREFVTEVYKYDSIPRGYLDGKINRVTADGPCWNDLFRSR